MTDDLIKVKDHPGLYRDPVTKAIIVHDPVGRKSYHNQRAILEKTMVTNDILREEINTIKGEVEDVKSMLSDILQFIKTNQPTK